MTGGGEEPADRGLLDDLTGVHDHDPVADLGHDAQVVSHEQHAHAELRAQRAEQLEDLGLDGDVERGGRLVRDQESRLARQRHRDQDPLTHPARERVWVVVGPGRGVGDADPVQHLDGSGPRGAVGASPVLADHLGDLAADGERRIEAGHRLLKHHRELVAA